MSKIEIKNPSNDEPIESFDVTENLEQIFERATAAQKKWVKVPLKSRIDIIEKFKNSLIKQKARLANDLSREMGKPITQSLGEIGAVTKRIDFFNSSIADQMKKQQVHQEEGLLEMISYDPLGVIVNISAWNYPYFVGLNVLVPALLTGNAIIYKPSEVALLTGLNITKLLYEAGIDPELVPCVIGDGKVGSALLDLPINGVFFTGSYATGRKIAEKVAGRFIKTGFELGGKDGAYITEDVHVKQVAEATVDGAFYNAGQSCCAIERIYVHEKIANEFIEHYVNTANSLTMGDPLIEKTYIGPLARKPQLEYLKNQENDALKKGAKPLLNERTVPDKGNFYRPQVFANVNHDMDIMSEESFGPIIGIQVVGSDKEAIELMKDTPYGLTSAIYSKYAERAKEVLAEMNTGTVYWNCSDRVSPNLPWSGRNHSGIGSTLSTLGILTFVQPKAWHLRQP